jgi:hypothetical protein
MSNPGIEATRQLAYMGYRFIVDWKIITAKYEGPGEPVPGPGVAPPGPGKGTQAGSAGFSDSGPA